MENWTVSDEMDAAMEKPVPLIRWLKVGRVRADWFIWGRQMSVIRNGHDGDGDTSGDDDGDDAHPDGEEEADANKGDSKLPTPILPTFSIRHLKTVKYGTFVSKKELQNVTDIV